jgi:hypothetical protein
MSYSGMLALRGGELLAECQILDELAATRVEKAGEDCKKDRNEVKHGVLL